MRTWKVRALISEVEAQGWEFMRWPGSHRQFTHPTRPGVVTIPGHPNDDLGSGLVAAIRRQAKGTPPPG